MLELFVCWIHVFGAVEHTYDCWKRNWEKNTSEDNEIAH